MGGGVAVTSNSGQRVGFVLEEGPPAVRVFSKIYTSPGHVERTKRKHFFPGNNTIAVGSIIIPSVLVVSRNLISRTEEVLLVRTLRQIAKGAIASAIRRPMGARIKSTLNTFEMKRVVGSSHQTLM